MLARLKQYSLSSLLLAGFAFALPISLPVAEGLLFLLLIVVLYHALRTDFLFDFRFPIAAPVVLFAVVAFCGVVFSSRPGISYSKLHRLLFLLSIFIIPRVLNAPKSLQPPQIVYAFLWGTSINAVYDFFRVPLYVLEGGNIYDAGSMTVPQFYAVALCFLTAMAGKKNWLGRENRKGIVRYLVALVLNLGGLVLHFKRGVWLATIICTGGVLVVKRHWRTILAGLLCVFAVIFIPQVQHRLKKLPNEFTIRQGGRWVLWTEVAPALISENPWGVGWHAVQHEDFLRHADYIQPHLNHLHNNLLQITLELGIVGGIVWSIWMIWTLIYMVFLVRDLERKKKPDYQVGLGVLSGFLLLLLNGMVENNFDDSEIMLLFCLLMGLSLALKRKNAV